MVAVGGHQLWANNGTKPVPWLGEPLRDRGCRMNGLARWGWLLGFQEQGDGSQGAQVQNRKLPKQLLTHCGAELTAHTSEGTAISSGSALLTVRPTSQKYL